MAEHMVVRWMGAFRHGSASLREAFVWELTQASREVAAERFDLRNGSQIDRTMVGLWLAPGTVRRYFRGDVWSYVDHNGDRLAPHRRPNRTHSECFCTPRYRAIVCACYWHELRPQARRAVEWAAQEFDLPVFVMTREGLRRITNFR